MKYLGYCLLLILFMTSIGFAQVDTLWTRTFGGEFGEGGQAVIETADGSIVAAGYTNSMGNGLYDVYVVKTDANGTLIWENTYGGSDRDYGYEIIETFDGNYVIVGYTMSTGNGAKDILLLKIDPDGEELWSHTYGYNGDEEGWAVCEAQNHDLILTGYTDLMGLVDDYQCYVIRTDFEGNVIWENQFSGDESEWGCAVLETPEGNIAIAGGTGSYGSRNRDVLLIHLAPDGEEIWISHAGYGDFDWGNDIVIARDSSFVIAGHSANHGIDADNVYVLSFSEEGNPVYQRRYGRNFYDYGRGICHAGESGYMIAGMSKIGLYTDLYILKTSDTCVREWEMFLGGEGNDWGSDIQPTSDGGFVISGHTDSFGSGSTDLWIVRLAGEESSTRENTQETPGHSMLDQNYPNPFNPETSISFTIEKNSHVSLAVYDRLGRFVTSLLSSTMNPGIHQVTFDASGLASGMYYYRLTTGEISCMRSMIVLK